jgi:hypothetical protein
VSPLSRRTGKRYAAGSHKRWGGWEAKVCVVCDAKIVLSRGSALHSAAHGSFCGPHIGSYPGPTKEVDA